MNPTSPIQVRKVSVLGDRLRKQADEMGLEENDLVIVRTTIKPGTLPKYDLEKIEGSPIQYLQKNLH